MLQAIAAWSFIFRWSKEMVINCAEACINGCVLGDRCPNLEYKAKTTQFIHETSLDKMLEMAENAVRKKRMEPPQWILPEE